MLDNFRVRLSSLAPVAFRVALGVVFIFHGWAKFQDVLHGVNPVLKTVEHWPFAQYFGIAAGTTEFVGGVCVALGLLTRFWSAGLVIQMLVAIVVVHGPNGFAGPKGFEYPFTLGLMALGMFLLGPGPLSVDYLLGRLIRGRGANAVIGCGARLPAGPMPNAE